MPKQADISILKGPMCVAPLKNQDHGGPSKNPPSSSVPLPPILPSRVELPSCSSSSRASRSPSKYSLGVLVVVVVVVVVVGHMAICQLKAKSFRSSTTCSSSFSCRRLVGKFSKSNLIVSAVSHLNSHTRLSIVLSLQVW